MLYEEIIELSAFKTKLDSRLRYSREGYTR